MSVSEDLARRALAAAAEQEKTGDKVVAKAMLAVASSGTVRALVAEAVAAAAAELRALRAENERLREALEQIYGDGERNCTCADSGWHGEGHCDDCLVRIADSAIQSVKEAQP